MSKPLAHIPLPIRAAQPRQTFFLGPLRSLVVPVSSLPPAIAGRDGESGEVPLAEGRRGGPEDSLRSPPSVAARHLPPIGDLRPLGEGRDVAAMPSAAAP